MDKREIELAKQNILKDRRRRLLYLNSDRTEGHHIQDTDMRFLSTLKNGDLIGLLIFLVLFGIMGQSLVISLAVLVAVSLTATIILNYVFLSKRPIIKLNAVDIAKTKTTDYLKALESNQFSKIIIMVVLALMILLRFMDPNKPLVGLEFEVARFSILFFMTYAAVLVPTYFRLRKQRKTSSNK